MGKLKGLNSSTYQQVYSKIEAELLDLAFHVSVNDDHLDVYSPKIVDLILRTCTEIESIAKDIYRESIENPRKNISYESALDKVGEKYKIADVEIKIYANELGLSDRFIKPFVGYKKEGGWKHAYAQLRHDRQVNQKEFGSINTLIKTMASLYVLGCVYDNLSSDHGGLINSTVFYRIFKDKDGKRYLWQNTVTRVNAYIDA